jgi:hypothetical protein
MWCVRTRSSAPRRLCRDGALHQSLGVDPVITPAYHRVRKTGVTWSDRTRVRAFRLSLLRQFSMAVAGPLSGRSPPGRQPGKHSDPKRKSPFHGGNRGSNPLGTPILFTTYKSMTYGVTMQARCIGGMYITCIGARAVDLGMRSRTQVASAGPVGYPRTNPPSIGITAPVT